MIRSSMHTQRTYTGAINTLLYKYIHQHILSTLSVQPCMHPHTTLIPLSVQLHVVATCTYITTYGSVSEKMSLRYIYYKSYKNHSRLNRYNFRTVHAIDFLFSPLHTTPFLYGKILFGVLHLLRARIATSDTPQGMNPS